MHRVKAEQSDESGETTNRCAKGSGDERNEPDQRWRKTGEREKQRGYELLWFLRYFRSTNGGSRVLRSRIHFLLGFHDISLHPYNEASLISASLKPSLSFAPN